MAGAMIFGSDAVASPDAVGLPTSNDYWFTQGNGTSVQGTQVPAYWVNKVGGEIDALISRFATLDMTNRGQITAILTAGFAGVLAGDAMPSLSDLNAAGLGWSTYQASSANAPNTSPGVVSTVSSNGATGGTGFQIIQQSAHDSSGSLTFSRVKVSGGTWSSWVRAAALNGDTTQLFSVANATATAHATALGQFVNNTASGFTIPALPYPIIVQFGYDSVAPGGGTGMTYTKALPTPFPHALDFIIPCVGTAFPNGVIGLSIIGGDAGHYTAANGAPSGGSTEGYTYMAVGH